MVVLQSHTESCHPIIRASSAFERGDLRSNGHGKKSTQFNENKGNIELLLRTVISTEPLQICAKNLVKIQPKIHTKFRKLGNS